MSLQRNSVVISALKFKLSGMTKWIAVRSLFIGSVNMYSKFEQRALVNVDSDIECKIFVNIFKKI